MSENRHIQLARNSQVGVLPTTDRLLDGEIALNNNINALIISTIASDGTVQQVNGVGRYQFTENSGSDSATTPYYIGETFNYSGNTAIGDYSHAEGRRTTASGHHSHSEGQRTSAIGYGSHAEGVNTQANKYCSHAEGEYTKANGTYSHAEGKSTSANGNSSHAEGYNTITTNYAEHANGTYNISRSAANQSLTALTSSSAATLFSIGNGTSPSNKKNTFEVKYNGDIYLGNNKDDSTLYINNPNFTIDVGEY